MSIKNPLRYPGGKSKLYNYVYNLLLVENKTGCTFYEPYAGSASLSLLLLESGIINNSILNEKDPLLYNFWISVFNNENELIRLIENTDINITNWEYYSNFRNADFITDKTPIEIGFACLFLNRTNFSGILKANPLGGLKQLSDYKIDCRFNKNAIINSILELSTYRDRIHIYNMDAIDFMRSILRYKRNTSSFVYIDPPYYKEGPGLYRYYYTYNDHKNLAQYMKSKTFPWLISYDDVPEIRDLYRRSNYIDIYLDYSVHTSKKGAELLISNLHIPPILQNQLESVI